MGAKTDNRVRWTTAEWDILIERAAVWKEQHPADSHSAILRRVQVELPANRRRRIVSGIRKVAHRIDERVAALRQARIAERQLASAERLLTPSRGTGGSAAPTPIPPPPRAAAPAEAAPHPLLLAIPLEDLLVEALRRVRELQPVEERLRRHTEALSTLEQAVSGFGNAMNQVLRSVVRPPAG